MPVCGNYLFFELPKKIVLNPKDGPFRIFSIILMVSVFAVLRFFVLLALLRPLTILILLTYTFFSFIGFFHVPSLLESYFVQCVS